MSETHDQDSSDAGADGEATHGPFPILVVDDDEDVRGIMQDVLIDAGYTVECAVNGADALRALQTSAVRPQLICLDVEMPVMNGPEFLLHRPPEFKDIPVIVTTGSTRLVEGVVALLRKPIELKRLLRIIALCKRSAFLRGR